MGGRGALTGGGGGASGSKWVKASSDGTLMRAQPRIIEGIYREGGRGYARYYKQEVLEATTDGQGNLNFRYAYPVSREKQSKTGRTHYLTYEVAHGALDGETFNINWKKVKSIKGQTYSLREQARNAGLKWDRELKMWKR